MSGVLGLLEGAWRPCCPQERWSHGIHEVALSQGRGPAGRTRLTLQRPESELLTSENVEESSGAGENEPFVFTSSSRTNRLADDEKSLSFFIQGGIWIEDTAICHVPGGTFYCESLFKVGKLRHRGAESLARGHTWLISGGVGI